MPWSRDARTSRPRASALAAWVDGWRRTLGLWRYAVGILALTAVLALPLALGLRSAIEADLGPSQAAGRLAEGWDAAWAAEFARDATGLEQTLSHAVIGFGGSLTIASDLLDGRPLPAPIAAVVVIHLVCWLFLWGGLLDRLAGPRRGGPVGFFAASGNYAFRFLRLAVMSGAAYWLILTQLHPRIFDALYPALVRDMTSEWLVAATRVAGYLVFLAAVAIVAVTTDMARVRTVVEDRRSMLGAIVAALRFIRRRPMGVAALVALNGAVLLLVLAVWAVAAPGGNAGTLVAIGATQAYLLARILTRLSLAASLLALVQAEFPRADRPAPLPEPIWPDAPAATSDDLL